MDASSTTESPMEIVVLVAILALLLFGPRRRGGMPGRTAIIGGIAFLVWLAMAFGIGGLWRAIVGDVP
jgi:hypothetical protein